MVDQINKQTLHLVSQIPSSVNHYLAYRAIIRNGKPMAMSYKTSEAVKYQKHFANYVKQECINQQWVKSDNLFQHYYMDCNFYFPRIDMDCNNYFKCMADAITDSQTVWIDDTQLCERVQRIFYDPANPRIELSIYPVEYIGIFDNMSQLDEFKSNCIQCSRYKNGKCSIWNKCLEGRITEEVANKTCIKFKVLKEKK